MSSAASHPPFEDREAMARDAQSRALRAKTPLGRHMLQLRASMLRSGEPFVTVHDLLAQVARNRGEID